LKLIELDPRWFTFNGERAGFIFKCPCCPNAPTYLTCKNRILKISEQWDIVEKQFPDIDLSELVPAKELFAWQIVGDDFNTLSVTPSIDASASGDWHGHITNGEIK
jgi:hypothetical protein